MLVQGRLTEAKTRKSLLGSHSVTYIMLRARCLLIFTARPTSGFHPQSQQQGAGDDHLPSGLSVFSTCSHRTLGLAYSHVRGQQRVVQLLHVKWSGSVVSNSLWPHGLYSSWHSPGQNTGVGSLFLLQGIFLTQGSNPGLPHCRRIPGFFVWTDFLKQHPSLTLTSSLNEQQLKSEKHLH